MDSPSRRFDVLAVFLFGFALILLRLPNVGEHGFHLDDILHLTVAQSRTWKTLVFGPWWYCHPPIYFLLVKIVGMAKSSELLLRSLQLVLGSSVLVLAFRWLRYFVSPLRALAITIFIGQSSVFIFLNYELRGYLLGLGFLLLQAILGEEWLKTKKARYGVLSFFCGVLSFLTEFGFGIAGCVFSLYQITSAAKKNVSKKQIALLVTLNAFYLGCALLLYFFHLRFAMQSLRDIQYLDTQVLSNTAGVLGKIHTMSVEWSKLLLDPVWHEPWSAILVLFIINVLALKRLYSIKKNRGPWIEFSILAYLPVILGIVLSLVGLYPFSNGRHCLYLLPSGLFLLALVIDEVFVFRIFFEVKTPVSVVFFVVLVFTQFKKEAEAFEKFQIAAPRKSVLDANAELIREAVSRVDFVVVDRFTSTVLPYLMSGVRPKLADLSVVFGSETRIFNHGPFVFSRSPNLKLPMIFSQLGRTTARGLLLSLYPTGARDLKKLASAGEDFKVLYFRDSPTAQEAIAMIEFSATANLN